MSRFPDKEDPMYVFREIMSCRPGKVRELMQKFKAIAAAVEDAGLKPVRLLTDVSGERFWTMVAEVEVERLDDFFAMEQKLMGNAALRKSMEGYHDLVDQGRREIYRLEP
jgi:hypothetical protein